MNSTPHSDSPDLEPPLESAVWAVVGERIPADAVERVRQRAKSLALADGVPTNSRDRGATSAFPARQPQSGAPRRSLTIGAMLAIAASLILIVSSSLMTPSTSMAQVVSKTIAQRWVHATVTWSSNSTRRDEKAANNASGKAGSPIVSEIWFSSELGIVAARLPDRILFEDRTANVAVNYEIGSPAAIQTLPVPREMQSADQGRALLDRLRSLQESGRTESGYVVKEFKEQRTQGNGDSRLQYTFQLVRSGHPADTRDMTLTLDRQNQLAESMEEAFRDGSRRVTRFQYPASGPADMFAAGVPRDAQVIDRRASTDIRRLESTWAKARREFDDYDAVVVQVPDGLKHSVFTGLNADVKRVRRKGARYRVDVLLRPMPGVEAPAEGTDMEQWWAAHRDQFWSVPLLICDGSTVTYYSMVDGRLPKDGAPNLNVVLRNQHPVRGTNSDPQVAWPHMMPEYAARPHLWTTDVKRRFEYSPTPDDGPGESVRLIVSKPDETQTLERHRYWLAPFKGFCLVRMVQPVFEPKSDDVAYVDTEELGGFKKSPSGFWYPTRVERKTSETSEMQIRSYHVDFVTTLDSALFEPPQLDGPK